MTEKAYSDNDRDELLEEGVRQILGTSVPSKAIDNARVCARVHMHKYLCSGSAQVNHENGNGLDDRRENLRGVGKAD